MKKLQTIGWFIAIVFLNIITLLVGIVIISYEVIKQCWLKRRKYERKPDLFKAKEPAEQTTEQPVLEDKR